MTTVVSSRIPDELAARLDALLSDAGLKNRSQAVALALLRWIESREGKGCLEDRIAARVQGVIRSELERVQVSGPAPSAKGEPDHAAKMRKFLDAGRH